MLRIQTYFVCAFIAFYLHGCQSEGQDKARSVCLLQDPPNQCGDFCLSVLEPLLNHIAKHQEQWNTSDALKLQDTQAKLNKIQTTLEGQTTSFDDLKGRLERTETNQKDLHNANQIKIEGLQSSLQEMGKNFEERLLKIEVQQNAFQTKMETERAALQTTLTRIFHKIEFPKFKLIGSRYFYIDDTEKSWLEAKESCREMGAHLAAIKDAEELAAIKVKLTKNRYWLGINDREFSGIYMSVASGKVAPFLKWGSGEPNHAGNAERCIELLGGIEMNDNKCSDKYGFICQSDTEF
ncbi:CD209 antigen [Drosophila elegans]|uniref:CD209 antigen n=1 Tax=Drosophila elegans TaxID=30023 RepID=UPI001BC83107|nr:CD209 antigen [Drosophila elegans]